MTRITQPSEVRLLPIRPVRVVMLSFFVALSFVEIGSGVVVSEAWRRKRDFASLDLADMVRLDELLGRLRDLEAVIAALAVLATITWTFLAVSNVKRAARTSRSALFAVLAWFIAPVMVMIIGRYSDDHGIVHLGIVLLALEAMTLFLPFGLLAGASVDVGGERAPFRRWYLALVLAFVVNQVFTSPVHLDRLGPDDDLARAAVLSMLNGMVVAVMTLLAADATRALQGATSEKAFRHNQTGLDAVARFQLRIPRPKPEVAPLPVGHGSEQ